MSNTFSVLIRDACSASLQVEYERLEKLDIRVEQTKVLSMEDIRMLSYKISALPLEYMNIIFFRYCFEISPSDTSDILEVDNVAGKLRYIRKMLSSFMGLGELLIDNSSMRQASTITLEQYTSADETAIMVKPHYSAEFRRKLKVIISAQSTSNVITLVIKRVAVFILVCAISFSTALVANAELREQFLNWMVEAFPQFSIFMPQATNSTSQQADTDLTDFIVGYVPEDFKLSDKTQMRSMVVYHYADSQDKTLSITLARDMRFHKDTEEAVITDATHYSQVSIKGTITPYWANITDIFPAISSSGTTLYPEVYIEAKSSSPKITGTMYLEKLSSGKWTRVTSWIIGGTGYASISKAYTGVAGLQYRTRVIVNVGTESAEAISNSCSI